MQIILALLIVVCGLMIAAAGATVVSLRASDPAGNGLAEVYLAGIVLALWGLIGLSLLVAAFRRVRRDLPWVWIDVTTVLLFVGAAAAQIGVLQQLSGHHSEGVYRVILQLAVVVAPLAALLHIAWRGLASQAPNWWATKLAAVLVILASVTPLWGLQRPAPSQSRRDRVDDVVFPAVMLREGGSVIVVNSAGELRRMPSPYVSSSPAPPFLIDERLQIFVLRDLRSAGGARRSPATGETVEVMFNLIDWEPDATPEAALNILLRAGAFGSSLEQDAAIRRTLAAETTLDGMITAIQQVSR